MLFITLLSHSLISHHSLSSATCILHYSHVELLLVPKLAVLFLDSEYKSLYPVDLIHHSTHALSQATFSVSLRPHVGRLSALGSFSWNSQPMSAIHSASFLCALIILYAFCRCASHALNYCFFDSSNNLRDSYDQDRPYSSLYPQHLT